MINVASSAIFGISVLCILIIITIVINHYSKTSNSRDILTPKKYEADRKIARKRNKWFNK